MLESLRQLEFGGRKLPLLLQSEAAECGLACLAMVASYHGLRTDLAAVRARFSVSLAGARLDTLMQYGATLGLTGRAVRLDLTDLAELATPCVLHWDMNHFVVLARADAGGIELHDPAFGLRRLSYAEADGHFTGIALELAPSTAFRPADVRRRVSLSAMLGSVTGLWQGFGLVFVMALALEAFVLAAPQLHQWVVDEALVAGDRGLLNVLALATLMLLLTQTAVGLARDWTLLHLSSNLGLKWSSGVLRHLLHLPMVWFERRHLGDVVSRFGAVGAIQQTITVGLVAAVLDGLMALATGAMMLHYSPALSGVVAGTVLVYGLLRALTYRAQREAGAQGLALAAKEQSCLLESIRAMQAIKLAGRELDRGNRWSNLKVDAMNASIRSQKLGLVAGNASSVVNGASSLLILWLGAGMALDGSFTVGMLFAFTSYGGQFSARMAALIDKAIDLRMLSLQADRLADIVLTPTEAPAPDDGRAATLPARIELVDVSFRYSPADPWVLRHVSLSIEPGESVALVGPSGGGKTTLVKLILGTLAPTEGEIRYGGVALRQLGIGAYRRVLAAVMQDDQLLTGSLRENISFFDPQPEQARIEASAAQASVHADIERMAMGYETLVGDMGSTLSGGQKQRVLLARALYRAPRVLVLDEATSHLDLPTERAVNAAIAALDLTRIIVAHRPETIASARRVVALVGGQIVKDVLMGRDNAPTPASA